MRKWIVGVGLVFWLLVFITLGAEARAETSPVVVNHHGVVQSTELRSCYVAASVPCTLFAGLDSGWLDSDYGWHSVWTQKPSHGWHWATARERQRFHLTPMNQVRRRHGHVTWFRGPTGERWANVRGTNSEHLS